MGIQALLAGGTSCDSGLACSATPVLIGHVAGATKTIRVGSGGVMLPNHAPLVIAEQFGTLEAMYPGRIDLGLGRAPGGDPYTMRALRRDLQQSGDDFPGAAGGIADLPGTGEAGTSGESDSWTRKQRADNVAWVEPFQRAAGGHVGFAVCLCGAFCSRISVCRGGALPRANSVQVRSCRSRI